MSTLVDTNREQVVIVNGNDLSGDMGGSTCGLGADLRAALVGTTPPDDTFAESIAEALSMIASEKELRPLPQPGR